MRDARLDPALIERISRDLAACIPGGLLPERLGVAVSGGADSLALMILAKAAVPDVQAATVDHALRPEARDEALFVARVAASLGVGHSILTLAGTPRGNVPDWARRERYRALEDWALDGDIPVILTAHHADDQLETMIMRLNRGAGVSGLSGVRSYRSGRVDIARPLLGWRKEELEALVRSAGIDAVSDPSNRDDRFDRARLRKALAGADWLDPVAANRTAGALADADLALDWAARAYAGRRVAEKGGVISLDPKGLPRELLRRILLDCLARISPDAAPRGDEIDRLMLGLFEGRIATLAGVRCTGGTFWLFAKAAPRRTGSAQPG